MSVGNQKSGAENELKEDTSTIQAYECEGNAKNTHNSNTTEP